MNCNGFSTSSLTAIKKTWNQAAGVVVQISLTIHLVTNVPEVVDTYFMNSSSWQASSFCDHPSSSNESILDVIMISNGIVLLVLVGHHLWKWFLLPPCMVACTHIKCQYPFYSITLLFYRLFETKKKKKKNHPIATETIISHRFNQYPWNHFHQSNWPSERMDLISLEGNLPVQLLPALLISSFWCSGMVGQHWIFWNQLIG